MIQTSFRFETTICDFFCFSIVKSTDNLVEIVTKVRTREFSKVEHQLQSKYGLEQILCGICFQGHHKIVSDEKIYVENIILRIDGLTSDSRRYPHGCFHHIEPYRGARACRWRPIYALLPNLKKKTLFFLPSIREGSINLVVFLLHTGGQMFFLCLLSNAWPAPATYPHRSVCEYCCGPRVGRSR